MLLFILLFASALQVMAETKEYEKNLELVHELRYIEREPGVDEYVVTMLVSDRYIRIDETGDGSGFIVYDDKKKIIYSVSNHEQAVLVINEHKFTDENSPAKFNIEYLQLSDAPSVSGNNVFNYRAYAGHGDAEVTCTEIQLVENLLPEVRELLKNYQKVISGQHVKMANNKITDVQTACYFVDQIYNTGAYYEKGLPIQEWHSNDRSKILTSFKEVTVDRDKFDVPESYRQFSINGNSKTFIK
jgi:hypothetical protein